MWQGVLIIHEQFMLMKRDTIHMGIKYFLLEPWILWTLPVRMTWKSIPAKFMITLVKSNRGREQRGKFIAQYYQRWYILFSHFMRLQIMIEGQLYVSCKHLAIALYASVVAPSYPYRIYQISAPLGLFSRCVHTCIQVFGIFQLQRPRQIRL